MSVASRDELGRTTIAFGMPQNTPGQITVDGDLYEQGPVACLRFEMDSEPEEYVARQQSEIDFGTFRLKVRGAARVEGGFTLSKEQTEALIAALREQIEGPFDDWPPKEKTS